MLAALIALGLFLMAVGFWGLLRPNALQRMVASIGSSLRYTIAVGVRVALGVFLLQVAPEARWPEATRVLGYFTLAAAAVLLVMGPARLERFVAWWARRPAGVIRLAACFALGVGLLVVVDAL